MIKKTSILCMIFYLMFTSIVAASNNQQAENTMGEIKNPSPSKVIEQTYVPGNFTHSISTVDKDGNIWAVAWQDLIRVSNDGTNFKTVLDAKPFLDKENKETISLYGFYISDTGRIIACTNKGRVLVSNEERTELREAFTFKAGYTQNTWGHDKYNNYILMASYGKHDASNPPREVYFSKDHGETWEKIFDKPISEMFDPSYYHIHDVAFDQYSNMILISIGDGVNRQIHYSYDFGETWQNVFDETVYGKDNVAPIHPTSILVFPDGIAFGSDELPEGISWWKRPENVEKPEIRWEDIEYKITFGKANDNLIGTYATKGDTLEVNGQIFGVMPFRNHVTKTEGHTRLFATGDGGQSWHEIFREVEWSPEYKGFFNAFLREENGNVYIYATYSKLGNVYVWKAKMPGFSKENVLETYSLIYDENGATSGKTPVDLNRYFNGDVAIVNNSGSLKKDGHVFSCWNTKADGSGEDYNIWDAITVEDQNIILYAKWEVAPSADAFIERAESLESPYSALSVYEQGIEFYPLDYRFHEGINKNLNTILSWAMSSHQRGNFSTAMSSYSRAINCKWADSLLVERAKTLYSLAQENRLIDTVDSIIEEAKSTDSPYKALSIYEKGLLIYPQNSQLKNGVNESARIILSWSEGSRKRGDLYSCISGYRRVASSKWVDEDIKLEALTFLNYIENPDNIFEHAKSTDSPYKALSIYEEGLSIYPQNSQLKNGVNESAKIILEWSRKSHMRNSFGSAIHGYNIILKSKWVDEELKNEVTILLSYAREGVLFD